MSNFKFVEDLFLGKQELKKLFQILQNNIRMSRILEATSFGILQNVLQNFIVSQGTNSETVQIAVDSYALDADGNLITQIPLDNIEVPTDDGIFYWLKVSYNYTNKEAGTINIDKYGNIFGTDTNFLEVLRGGAGFPSKISFPNAVSNTGEYEVNDIIDDNNAILSGSFIAESDLEYKIVGSFTPGKVVSLAEKFPFEYDSCTLEWVVETALDTPPLGKVQDYEFYIARVVNNSGTVTIQDKITEYYNAH